MDNNPHKTYQDIGHQAESGSLTGLIRALFKYPNRVVKQLTIKNVSRLAKILREERLGTILGNAKRLIVDNRTAFVGVNALTPQEQYERYLKAQMPFETDATLFNPTLISIVCPIYKPDLMYLNEAIASVQQQSIVLWELILYDDGTNDQALIDLLKKWREADDRIKVIQGIENNGISEATNAAIAYAKGSYVLLLDQDDVLHMDALQHLTHAIQEAPADIYYSDHDKLKGDKRVLPYFKPDWNPTLLSNYAYLGHFLAIRKEFGNALGWFRSAYDGAQDFDFLLRSIHARAKVEHITQVLYHWRIHQGSTASGISVKPQVEGVSVKALEDYATKRDLHAQVMKAIVPNCYRIKWSLKTYGKINIVICFRDEAEMTIQTINSIFEHTIIDNWQIHLINNDSQDHTMETIQKAVNGRSNIKLWNYPEAFNFAKMHNWIVSQLEGEMILLLNNDIEILNSAWLTEMISQLQQPKVGAVGAKLLYPDMTVQHAGVVIGIGGSAGHVFKHFPHDQHGYYGRADLVQEYSAVTGACLLTYLDIYKSVGGMDEELAVSFNDIDYCLTLRTHGYRVVYTPYAQAIHHESKTRGYDRSKSKLQRLKQEATYFRSKWPSYIDNDPFYHPALSRKHTDFSIAT